MIKSLIVFGFILFEVLTAYSQKSFLQNDKQQNGGFYLYWGWNRGGYSSSDIRFVGQDYDFVLYDVLATDKQSKFSIRTYFGITKFTIPQYNFRIGYFVNHNWDISLGMDHMKYVVTADQLVNISGEISNTDTQYNNSYKNQRLEIIFE